MSAATRSATFIGLVIAAGAAVVATAALQWHGEDLALLAALVGLAILSEVLDFAPFPKSRVSLSVALILVAATVSGLPGVVIVVSAAAATDFIVHPKPWYKAAFNEGALLLAGAAYVGVFEAFATGYSNEDWPVVLAPAMIGAGLNFAVNSSLVALAIALETRSQPILVWNERFRWLLPHYVIVGVLAAAMAVAYDDWALAGIGLVLVPLTMVWLGMKQYVGMASALSHRHQGA